MAKLTPKQISQLRRIRYFNDNNGLNAILADAILTLAGE